MYSRSIFRPILVFILIPVDVLITYLLWDMIFESWTALILMICYQFWTLSFTFMIFYQDYYGKIFFATKLSTKFKKNDFKMIFIELPARGMDCCRACWNPVVFTCELINTNCRRLFLFHQKQDQEIQQVPAPSAPPLSTSLP